MTDNIVHKVLIIIKSRFKKNTEDKEAKRLRSICKSCEFNSKNLDYIPWKKRVLIAVSDTYSWMTGKKEEDSLGNCSICTCSVYYKTQEYKFEECPKNKWQTTIKMNMEKILVVDISYLTAEYRDLSEQEVRTKLELEYNYRVILIDSQRGNLDGASTNNTNPPIYFA